MKIPITPFQNNLLHACSGFSLSAFGAPYIVQICHDPHDSKYLTALKASLFVASNLQVLHAIMTSIKNTPEDLGTKSHLLAAIAANGWALGKLAFARVNPETGALQFRTISKLTNLEILLFSAACALAATSYVTDYIGVASLLTVGATFLFASAVK